MGKEKKTDPESNAVQDPPTIEEFSFDSRYMLIFSTIAVLLGSAITVYLIVGAMYFIPLEANTENEDIISLASSHDELFHNLRKEKMNEKVDTKEKFIKLASGHLAKFEDVRLVVFRKRTSDDLNASSWTTHGSIIFTSSVVTTIGWGNIAPKTSMGRVSCIVYAIFGIPMLFSFAAILSSILNVVASFFAFILNRILTELDAKKLKKRFAKKNTSANYTSWPAVSVTESKSFHHDRRLERGIHLSTKRQRIRNPGSHLKSDPNQHAGICHYVEGPDIFPTPRYAAKPGIIEDKPCRYKRTKDKRQLECLNCADADPKNIALVRSKKEWGVPSSRLPEQKYKQDNIWMSNSRGYEENGLVGHPVEGISHGRFFNSPKKQFDNYAEYAKAKGKICDDKIRQMCPGIPTSKQSATLPGLKNVHKLKKEMSKYNADTSLDCNIRDHFHEVSQSCKHNKTHSGSSSDSVSYGKGRNTGLQCLSDETYLDPKLCRRFDDFVVVRQNTELDYESGDELNKRDPRPKYNEDNAPCRTSDDILLDYAFLRPWCRSDDAVLNHKDTRINYGYDDAVLDCKNIRNSRTSDDIVLNCWNIRRSRTSDDAVLDCRNIRHSQTSDDAVLDHGNINPNHEPDNAVFDQQKKYIFEDGSVNFRQNCNLACVSLADWPNKSIGDIYSVRDKVNRVPCGRRSRHRFDCPLDHRSKHDFDNVDIETKDTSEDCSLYLKLNHEYENIPLDIRPNHNYVYSHAKRRHISLLNSQYSPEDTIEKIENESKDNLDSTNTDLPLRETVLKEQQKSNENNKYAFADIPNTDSVARNQVQSKCNDVFGTETKTTLISARTRRIKKIKELHGLLEYMSERNCCDLDYNYNQNAKRKMDSSDSESASTVEDNKEQDVLELEDETTAEKKVPFLVYIITTSIYIIIGGIFFKDLEPDGVFIDGLYFTFIMLTTIGFGDIVPTPERYVILLVYGALGLALANFVTNMMIDKIVDKIERFTVYFEYKIGLLKDQGK